MHHGVLSLSAAVTAGSGVARVGAAAPVKPGKEPADLGYISVGCAEYGLESDTLLVHATPEPSRLQASGAAFGVSSVRQVGSDKPEASFLSALESTIFRKEQLRDTVGFRLQVNRRLRRRGADFWSTIYLQSTPAGLPLMQRAFVKRWRRICDQSSPPLPEPNRTSQIPCRCPSVTTWIFRPIYGGRYKR